METNETTDARPSTNLPAVADRAAVALASTETEKKLRELAKKFASIVKVIDKAGREQAHGAAMELQRARTAIVKVSKAARDDANKFSKAVIAEEERLIAITATEETRLFAVRDAYDQEQERIKAEKAAAEAARIAGLRQRIADLQGPVLDMAINGTSEAIQVHIDAASAISFDQEEFGDLYGDAELAKMNALKSLRALLETAVAREAEALRAKEEAARLERERIEAEKVQVVKSRISEIASYPLQFIGKDKATVAAAIDALQVPTDAEFGVLHADALNAYALAKAGLEGILATLRQAEVAAKAAAEDAARREAEIAESIRLQNERDAQHQAELKRQRELAKSQEDAFAAELAEAERQRRASEDEAKAARKQAQDIIDKANAEALAAAQAAEAEVAKAAEAEAAKAAEAEKAAAEAQAVRSISLDDSRPEDDEIVQAIADHFDVTFDTAIGWLDSYSSANALALQQARGVTA